MPLEKSRSNAAKSHNIAEMVKAGHPVNQAVAAASRIQRGGDMLARAAKAGQDPEAQRQARKLLSGGYVSGSDRAKLKR